MWINGLVLLPTENRKGEYLRVRSFHIARDGLKMLNMVINESRLEQSFMKRCLLQQTKVGPKLFQFYSNIKWTCSHLLVSSLIGIPNPPKWNSLEECPEQPSCRLM